MVDIRFQRPCCVSAVGAEALRHSLVRIAVFHIEVLRTEAIHTVVHRTWAGRYRSILGFGRSIRCCLAVRSTEEAVGCCSKVGYCIDLVLRPSQCRSRVGGQLCGGDGL